MGFVLDHLWQSTLFTVVAAVLAWALRRHQARARYVVWLVASAKFLIPYASLVAIARLIPWRKSVSSIPPSTSLFLDTADAVSAPFSAASSPAVRSLATSHTPWLTIIVAAVWLAGTMTLAIRWIVLSRRLRSAHQRQAPSSERERDVVLRIAARTSSVDVVLVDAGVEPGVAGVFSPVLYWPRGLAERLTDEQIEAVAAHEMAHVRWHDNAAAMAHMVVEALFWFHPLVWWLGARLVDERERGCDEAVLRVGGERRAYAEGILRICEFYVVSPIPTVSGVGGSDLRRRIELIMCGQVGHVLRRRNAWLVGSALVVAVSVPVGVAAWHATQLPAPALATFEAASIKPNTTGSMGGRCCWEPGGLFVGVNITAAGLISGGYPSKVHELIGAPDWLSRDRFDVTARAASEPTPEERRQMVQAFLADRFKLTAHFQSEERSVYSLELARSDKRLGSQLHAVDIRCDLFKPLGQAPKRLMYDEPPCSFAMNAGGQGKVTIVSGGRTMDDLGNTLSGLVGRPVVDRTHLAGYYEFSMEYPDEGTGGLFTALREQLGLKLESARAPLDVLVIDHVERPTVD